MDFITSIFGIPLGYVMWGCYSLVKNYGVALILFTLLVKLILFPFSFKQQKGMIKMARMQPKLMELQKKYGNNKQKLNEEMMKMYEKEGYNPMAGCLPLLLQFPILFGVIDVVYKPLTHILRFSGEAITTATDIAKNVLGTAFNISTPQISVINAVMQNPGAFSQLEGDFVSKIQGFDLSFLGINLGATPNSDFWSILLIVPILSGVTALIMSLVTMKTSVTSQQAGGGSKLMMLLLPLFSLYIAFIVPTGVGIYWVFSNVFAIVQSLILYKLYNPKLIAEQMALEEEQAKERERQERIAARRAAKEGDEEAKKKALSQKEINKERLKRARQLDAEKYGEEYSDLDDKDLM